MVWRELLQRGPELLEYPWVGGLNLCTPTRTFRLKGRRPREHGWYTFCTTGREARLMKPLEAPMNPRFQGIISGYLVGDRLLPTQVKVPTNPAKLVEASEQVHLIESGLDRFCRVSAGRFYENGPLIYRQLEMPLGSEEEVLEAFLNKKSTSRGIPDVTPALDAAFRFESWRRDQAEERRRLEREQREREEHERVQKERLEALRGHMGTAVGRREVAVTSFQEAATAALRVGGAEYLDHRAAHTPQEMVVRFRYRDRRFECTCHNRTLRIIDAGICLEDHHTGIKGDTWYTLESFPAVIGEAIDTRQLVVWRHLE